MDDKQEQVQKRARRVVGAPSASTTTLLELLVERIERVEGTETVPTAEGGQSFYDSAKGRALEALGVEDRAFSAPELITALTNRLKQMQEERRYGLPAAAPPNT